MERRLKTEKNRRDSGESKQVHLELEQNEGMGPGPEVGSGSKGCWRRQAGWVPPVAAETQERPAWSVAEEDSIFEQEDLGEIWTSKMGLEKGGGGCVIIAFSIDLNMLGHSGFAR